MYYGGDQEQKDYVEIWSGYPTGGNVVKAVEQRGGQAIGVGWNSGYDLEIDEVKKHVREQLEHEWRPKTLMVCPMCTGSGSWSRYNLARGAPLAIANRAKQGTNAQYTAVLIDDQCRRGGRVIFEHPWGTAFLHEKVMQQVIGRWGLGMIRLDQCMVGLFDQVSGRPHLKPTVIVTNDRVLSTPCPTVRPKS